MFKKLWVRLFVGLGIMLIIISGCIIALEKFCLLQFYTVKQKSVLLNSVAELENVDFSDSDASLDALNSLMQTNSITTEIYKPSGEVVYTSESSQAIDLFESKQLSFIMMHSPLILKNSKTYADGSVVSTGYDIRNNKYLVCQKKLENGYFAELRIRSELIKNSAATAGTLAIYITLLSILPALFVIYLLTRKFSKPISDITLITKDLASLDFSKRVSVKSNDEIAVLGNSVNDMADSLENALNELKDTNNKLNIALEEERNLDSMRKALVANVSHELKTPIAVISGYAEGLKLNVNSKKKQEYCDMILDESNRMNKLVLSILELARYESGKVQSVKERFDISEICKEMTETVFSGSNISATSEIEKGTFVFADILRTREILKAYLENALAFTEDGGFVKVFSSDYDGKLLKITVFNSGAHIDQSIMPFIWQSFYRGDTSHKRKDTSFGLGLSIVSALCKADGMQYGVYNTDDGVCFWFTAEKA